MNHPAPETGHAAQFGGHDRHPGLAERGPQADQDAGGGGWKKNLEKALAPADVAERLRHFYQISIHASDRALRSKEGDPENADGDDKDGVRLPYAEPDDRKGRPGEVRNRP